MIALQTIRIAAVAVTVQPPAAAARARALPPAMGWPLARRLSPPAGPWRMIVTAL